MSLTDPLMNMGVWSSSMISNSMSGAPSIYLKEKAKEMATLYPPELTEELTEDQQIKLAEIMLDAQI